MHSYIGFISIGEKNGILLQYDLVIYKKVKKTHVTRKLKSTCSSAANPAHLWGKSEKQMLENLFESANEGLSFPHAKILQFRTFKRFSAAPTHSNILATPRIVFSPE